MKRLRPSFSLLKVWEFLPKAPLLEFKWKKIGPKTFDSKFAGYAQNIVVCRFMSLNDFSIRYPRDAKFFEHDLPLKKNVSTTMHGTIFVHDNVPMFASSSFVRDSVDEPKRSKRCKVDTSFAS